MLKTSTRTFIEVMNRRSVEVNLVSTGAPIEPMVHHWQCVARVILQETWCDSKSSGSVVPIDPRSTPNCQLTATLPLRNRSCIWDSRSLHGDLLGRCLIELRGKIIRAGCQADYHCLWTWKPLRTPSVTLYTLTNHQYNSVTSTPN